MSVSTLMDTYMRVQAPRTLKHSTIRRYEGSQSPLAAVIGKIPAIKVTKAELAMYARVRMEGFSGEGMNFPAVKSMTVRRDLMFLSGCYAHAINEELLVSNPVSGFNLDTLPNSTLRVRWLGDHDFDRLTTECLKFSGMLHDAVVFAARTGMRFEEQFSMTWGWVDLVANVVNIPGSVTKTKQPRTLPLDETAQDILKSRASYINQCRFVFSHPAGPALTYVRCTHHSIYRPFKKAVAAAGLKDFRWHDLRHHAASRWVRGGADLYPVSRLLGHSSVTQSEKYAHLSVDALRKVVGG